MVGLRNGRNNAKLLVGCTVGSFVNERYEIGGLIKLFCQKRATSVLCFTFNDGLTAVTPFSTAVVLTIRPFDL